MAKRYKGHPPDCFCASCENKRVGRKPMKETRKRLNFSLGGLLDPDFDGEPISEHFKGNWDVSLPRFIEKKK